VACGELEVDELGYCLSCGHRQPEPGDHVEIDLGVLAAVSDRGKRHQHNEDAVALAGLGPDAAQPETAILVVCDGVSSTDGSADASQAAADAARNTLVDRFEQDPATSAADALTAAAAEAQKAAADCLGPDAEVGHSGAPSTTLVACVIQADTITTAWVGDSRAYWVGQEPKKLTGLDHEIQGSLIKWLGADSVDPAPEISSTELTGDGTVIVCTDGLWRYAVEPDDLAQLVAAATEAGATMPIELARALVDHANEAGGHDNITAAIYPVRAPAGPGATGSPAEQAETGETTT
jgi:serine/threonine protein phosphatase PrpC